MSAPSATDVIAEIQTLQQQVRRMKRLMSIALGIAAIALVNTVTIAWRPQPVAAQSGVVTFDKIRAREIEFLSPSGKRVRTLTVEGGEAMDAFFDERGNPRIMMRGNRGIAIRTSANPNVVALIGSAGETGITAIGLADEASRAGWAIRHSPQHGMIQMMKDGSGTIRMAAHVDSAGQFRFHVQKSALEQVGEVIDWAARLGALAR